MAQHEDIQRYAKSRFADHGLTKGPGYSWRMGQTKRGAYAFRVTWGPGVVVVSGDIGAAVYQVWPSFGSPWGAIDLISQAGFDYICEKGSIRTEFDRETTVEDLIRQGYESLRGGLRPDLFKLLCEEYGGDWDNIRDRKEAVRTFRDDHDLTAERIYNITSDPEAAIYSYPASARWTFEALKLWAATMKAREPTWHRAWRRVQREHRRLRSEIEAPRHFRPALYVVPKGHDGNKFWVRRTYERDGKTRAWMAAVIPFRPLGLDLSRIGLWREQGSSTPLSGGRDDGRFQPVGTDAGAARP